MRTLTVDDLSELEHIGRHFGPTCAVAPDGRSIAFVLQRSRASTAQHKWVRLLGNDRADIWLADDEGAPPTCITDGYTDGTGFWAPCWSPDGERLAMISTRGSNASLWVWERSSGNLRKLDPRGVALDFVRRPYVWLSSRQILCPLLDEGRLPYHMRMESGAMDAAMQAWPLAWEGKTPTASVLESGTSLLAAGRSEGEMCVVDVIDGTSRRVAIGLTEWSVTQVVAVSPDLSMVAFLQEIEGQHLEPADTLNFGGSYQFSIRIVAIDADAALVEGPRIGSDVVPGSLVWAPDSSQLAYVDFRDGRSRPPFIRSIRPSNGATHDYISGSLDAARPDDDPCLCWTDDGSLLVYAAPTLDGRGRAAPEVRRDWWRIDRTDDPRLLTAAFSSVPKELYAEPGWGSFVALSDGNLWRLYPDGRIPVSITQEFLPEVVEVAWPTEPATLQGAAAGYDQIIVKVRQDETIGFCRIDVPSATVAQLSQPEPGATLAQYDPDSATLLWSLIDDTGSYLWSIRKDGELALLWEGNVWLRDVVAGTTTLVEYHCQDGQPLHGWLLLPPDYSPERRYPLVVDVYPGSEHGGTTPPWRMRLNEAHPLGVQVLAAQGYAVLFPSMPAAPDGMIAEPLLELPKGVHPAINTVIRNGVADPERIYLMGHSLGGYAVYGLLTLTTRFRAAIALAGTANLASVYGSFDPRMRYDATAHQDMFMSALLEVGQGLMGVPPWMDASRYVRNSPLFYVDRVHTPLMIVQGDMDYVAMQQGEEFFTALHRQGKRAAFVRYWGEGHIVQSPANIQDMWQRILAWFAQFGGEERLQ